MINPGYKHTLKVGRFTDNGAYLCNDDGDEVLLPNRYVSDELKGDEEIEVFVYSDSEDRLVAVTDTPYIMAGEVAYLEVVAITAFGVFLDWGLPKDLFLPKANQTFRVEVGRRYVVGAYSDMVSGRVVATMKLGRMINNDVITVSEKEQVKIIVAQENEVGYRVVINNRNWGVLYYNQIFKPVAIGDILTAYVRKIAEDGRIDVSLQQEGFDQIKDSAEQLLDLIEANGGVLMLGDKSSPEEIYQTTLMSKKSFKRAVGHLFKKEMISIEDRSIKLK